MKINLAHLGTQGISFAVFDADARARSKTARSELLADLTAAARRNGLRVDKAALAYSTAGRLEFFGTPDLVRFLAGGWRPRWTHTITV